MEPGRREPRAWLTPSLVAANVLVLVAMVATGTDPMVPDNASLVRWGANFGVFTLHGEWWRLITSMFIHGGLVHLGFNVYVLWDLGKTVERLFGMVAFGIVYLVAGIGGSTASVMLHPMVVSVGASGAIFGVVGGFLAFLALNRTRLAPSVFSALRRSLLTFVVVNLVLGFSIPGIDQAAHIGGLLSGFLAGLLVAPTLTRDGPVRPYVRYGLALMLGVALCTAVAFGLRPVLF